MSDLPEPIRRRLPRYPVIPVVLLGRLAVASVFQGLKLGSWLVFDAAYRVDKSGIGAHAIVVDPIDDRAERFYAHHGFTALPGTGRRMFVVLSAITSLTSARS